MIEQSKTHPFNLSRGVKTFLPHIMKKGSKAVNFYFVFFESFFYQILLKANKIDTFDLREGTSPKLALGLGSEKQDLSPYLIRLRSFGPYLEK